MLSVYLSGFTDFFQQLGDLINVMSKENWSIYCGAVIFRHIGQLVCNGHAISELRGSFASENNCLEADSFNIKAGFLHRYFESTRVFTGIFPQISMFNHSCEPNIRNTFNKNTLTVYAAKDIPVGGEIFNCYGPNFKLMCKDERKSALRQQYGFDCKCTRCAMSNDEAYVRRNIFSNHRKITKLYILQESFEHYKCPFAKCSKYFMLKENADPFEKDIKCPMCKRIIDCSTFQLIAAGMTSEQESRYQFLTVTFSNLTQ